MSSTFSCPEGHYLIRAEGSNALYPSAPFFHGVCSDFSTTAHGAEKGGVQQLSVVPSGWDHYLDGPTGYSISNVSGDVNMTTPPPNLTHFWSSVPKTDPFATGFTKCAADEAISYIRFKQSGDQIIVEEVKCGKINTALRDHLNSLSQEKLQAIAFLLEINIILKTRLRELASAESTGLSTQELTEMLNQMEGNVQQYKASTGTLISANEVNIVKSNLSLIDRIRGLINETDDSVRDIVQTASVGVTSGVQSESPAIATVDAADVTPADAAMSTVAIAGNSVPGALARTNVVANDAVMEKVESPQLNIYLLLIIFIVLVVFIMLLGRNGNVKANSEQ